eukprot:TRINITY_DN72550_c0_g1_i1.p1 TRINITY_DN72550_c0_g1~~TRINITY_DN72550_c0_g1_i1.p1  ORF type:complete len:179 (-),score=35.02 TRINITY_DN72550_c0_g1_i1:132-668(-)
MPAFEMVPVEDLEWKSSMIPSTVMTTVQYAICAGIAYFVNSGGLMYCPASELKLPMIALTVYLYSLYILLFRQGLGKGILNKDLMNSTDSVIKANIASLNRVAENSLEQCPIFLAAFLTFSVLVNAKVGGILAFVYIAFMWLYLPLYGKVPLMFASTLPGYLIVEYMSVSVLIAAFRT